MTILPWEDRGRKIYASISALVRTGQPAHGNLVFPSKSLSAIG